jgi:hypothetical protein
MCWFSLKHFSLKFLILRSIERDILVFMQSTRYSCPIWMKLEHSRRIFEKYSNINFTQIRPVRAALFHADKWTDGRTDMMKLIVAFLNIVDTLKNSGKTDQFWQLWINRDSISPGFKEQSLTAVAIYSCIILKIQPKILSWRGVFIVSSFGWVTSILTWTCGS